MEWINNDHGEGEARKKNETYMYTWIYTLQYIHISYYPNQRKGFSITKIIGVISTVECTCSSKCLFWAALASRHHSGQKPTFPDIGTQYAISNPL